MVKHDPVRLFLHATEDFDPPLPALRRAGVRSRAETNREIHALKILRGDFDQRHESSDEASRARRHSARLRNDVNVSLR